MEMRSNIFVLVIISTFFGFGYGQRCPAGWTTFGSSAKCFRFMFLNQLSWTDARDMCKIHGGDLLRVDSADERNWVFAKINQIKTHSKLHSDDWWTGLNNRENPAYWVWADGMENKPNVLSWKPGTPNNVGGNEHCAVVNKGLLNDATCTTGHYYVCYRYRGIPLACDSDHGWQSLNGQCYKFYTAKASWYNARARCERDGGGMVTIDTQDTELFMHDFATAYKQQFWIGLYSVLQPGNFVQWNWTDGIQRFSNFWHNNPIVDSAHRNSSCVAVSNTVTDIYAWTVQPCSRAKAYVCSKPEGTCFPGWIGHQTWCYQFDVQYRLSFSSASSYCQDQGAELLRYTGSSMVSFVNSYRREIIDSGANSFWIGASDNNVNGGPYKWRNGQNVTYRYWAAAHNRPTNTVNKTDCAYISTSDRHGKWRTTNNCGSQKAFVCQVRMDQSVVAVPNTPRPYFGCSTNWKLNSGRCFRIFDQAVDWITARSKCQATPGADLAVIRSVTELNFVNHMAKSDVQYWLGLNDRAMEGAYVWNDANVAATYTAWAPGQPNNVAHQQNCVVLTKRQWNDLDCSNTRHYICSKEPNSVLPPVSTTQAMDWTVKCGVGWQSNPVTPYCYMFVDEPLSWLDALNQCKQYGGDLVAIETLEEQNYLAAMLQTMNSIAVWTGLNDRGTEELWHWTSGKPYAFLNWAAGQPGRNGEGTDCVAMFTGSAQWDDIDCRQRNGYVCEKIGMVPTTPPPPKTTMKVPAGWTLGCKPRWKPYSNYCFLFKRVHVSGTAAQTSCNRLGGHLASIHNKNEQDFITANVWHDGKEPFDTVWIGLNDRQTENRFQWSDGTDVTYTNWQTQEPNNLGNEDCVEARIQGRTFRDADTVVAVQELARQSAITQETEIDKEPEVKFAEIAITVMKEKSACQEIVIQNADVEHLRDADGTWNDESCTSIRAGFICKAPKGIVSATQNPYQTGCPMYSLGYGPYCYKMSWQAAKEWADANNDCNKTYHGTLATVNDRYTQSFLSSQLLWRTGYYWLGLSDSAKPETYAWASGDSVLFTYWHNTHTGNEKSTCVAMRADQPIGLWENLNCTQKGNYICQFPRTGGFTTLPTTPAPYPNVPCPTGWTAVQGNCYYAFAQKSDRRTWMDAMTHCRNLGGDLPSFHNTLNDSFINGFVQAKEGTRQTFWIGINDRDTEKGYVWSDGSAVDYTNWMTGEPNNAYGNEDCAMYYTDRQQWNDMNCYATYNYICVIPRGSTLPPTTVIPTPARSNLCGSDPNWYVLNDNCYMLNPTSGPNATLNWYDANDYCQGLGAQLASVHSNDENHFIFGITNVLDITNYWLGLNELGLNGFVWTDQTPLDYTMWDLNEPNDYQGAELCVEMRDFRGARWNDENCGVKRGYVCKKPVSGTVVIPSPSPYPPGGCANGFTRVPGGRNKCFYLNHEMLNWTTSRDHCRRFGTGYDLASVEDLFEQDYFMAMAANEKLNFWIGLSDRKTDNLFLWADNSPVVFTNWDRRQPPHANSKLVSRNHWAVSWFRYDEEEGFFNGPGGSTMVPESFL